MVSIQGVGITIAMICVLILARAPGLDEVAPKGQRGHPQEKALAKNGDRQVANDWPTELRRVDQIIRKYGKPDVRFFFGSADTEILLFCEWGYAVHVDRKGNVEDIRRLTRVPMTKRDGGR